MQMLNTVDPDKSDALGRRSKILDNWWIRTKFNNSDAPGS